MALADPKLTIRDLLKDNWNAANTSGVTPDVHTGHWNQEANNPQVTVTDPTEDIDLRGTDPSGAGLVRWMLGGVLVGCWSTRDASSVNPKQLTVEMSEEVDRIVTANRFGNTDLAWLEWRGREEFVDSRAEPTLYRYDCEVAYQLERRP